MFSLEEHVAEVLQAKEISLKEWQKILLEECWSNEVAIKVGRRWRCSAVKG